MQPLPCHTTDFWINLPSTYSTVHGVKESDKDLATKQQQTTLSILTVTFPCSFSNTWTHFPISVPPHPTPTPLPFLLCSNGPKKKSRPKWVSSTEQSLLVVKLDVSSFKCSLKFTLALCFTKLNIFDSINLEMNFPQHPDKGRSGRVRSIWRSITGANSGLAQHNYGPRVFRNVRVSI